MNSLRKKLLKAADITYYNILWLTSILQSIFLSVTMYLEIHLICIYTHHITLLLLSMWPEGQCHHKREHEMLYIKKHSSLVGPPLHLFSRMLWMLMTNLWRSCNFCFVCVPIGKRTNIRVVSQAEIRQTEDVFQIVSLITIQRSQLFVFKTININILFEKSSGRKVKIF